MDTKFDEYLDFPCDFTFKVLGVAEDALEEQVMSVIQTHAPGDYTPKVKPSSKGTYNSISVKVTVKSKEHVETLYQALGDLELVKYVL